MYILYVYFSCVPICIPFQVSKQATYPTPTPTWYDECYIWERLLGKFE
jgi:hypothetical protein